MKRFKFRLERVLQYRALIKEEKKRQLMIKNSELFAAKETLSFLELAQLNNDIKENRVMTASELQLVNDYGFRLREEIVNSKLEIIRIEGEVEEALQAYIEAAKDTRALELLKEKKQQEYKELVAKEETKYLDELSIQRTQYNRTSFN